MNKQKMTIKKQKTFMGKPIKGAMKRFLEKLEKKGGGIGQSGQRQLVQVAANTNLQDYIQVSKTGYIIAKEQTDNNLQYEPTHKQVLQRGLEIPTPYLFTTHLLNVIEAKQGRVQLYDGLGQVLNDAQVEEVYNRLTSNCWNWLNAGFKKIRDENPDEPWKDYDIEIVTGLDLNGNLIKETSPLEKCLWEDSFIDLTDNQFNKQGLATQKSASENYVQGKVIKFWKPVDNCVAGFYADSDRAYLVCYRDPSGSDPSLGVFGVCKANATQLAQNK